MTPQRAFLIQTFLEAAIPVIGYLAWGWDLSFILLFYLIDWLLAYGLTIAKGLKRLRYAGKASERQLFNKSLIVSLLLMLAACALIALALVQLNPALDWKVRTWEFLVYEELGIQQGLILIPLIVLNGILVYRQQFLFPQRFKVLDMAQITRPLQQQNLLLLATGGVLVGITYFVTFPEEILIAIAVAGISCYRFFVLRKMH